MPEITFYSKTPGLKTWAGKSKFESIEGTLKMVDPPLVSFTPLPSGGYGWYKTDDPAIIAYLEERILKNTDVISAEEFNKRMTPADVQIRLLEDKMRKIEEENRLLKQVKEQEQKKGLPVPPKVV